MTELKEKIRELIVRSLELAGVSTSDIDSDAAVFGEGFRRDSVDALEVGICIRKPYDPKLDIRSEDGRKHFRSIASLVNLIRSRQSQK